MKSLLNKIRIAVLGPRKVDDVVRSFHRAVADLQETAQHHKAIADEARLKVADAVAAQAHAERVQAKIQSIIA